MINKDLEINSKMKIKLFIKKLWTSIYWFLCSINFIKKSYVDQNGIIISKKNQLAYFPIAKCGCSSIKKIIFKSELGLSVNNVYDLHSKDDKKETLFVEKLPDSIELTKLIVVRNPFARFVSFYKDKFLEFNSGKYNGLRLEFGYNDYLNGILRSNMSFSDVARVVSKIPDRLSERHFQSQVFGVNIYEKDINSCVILRLEQQEELREFLSSKVEGFSVLSKENSTSSESSDSWENFYDEETLEIVYKRYKNDIETLGYMDEYIRLKEKIKNKTKSIQ